MMPKSPLKLALAALLLLAAPALAQTPKAIKDAQLSGTATVTGTLTSSGAGAITADAVSDAHATGTGSIVRDHTPHLFDPTVETSQLFYNPLAPGGQWWRVAINNSGNLVLTYEDEDNGVLKTPFTVNHSTGALSGVTLDAPTVSGATLTTSTVNGVTLSGSGTLTVGTGGTLGTAAYTATSAYDASGAASTVNSALNAAMADPTSNGSYAPMTWSESMSPTFPQATLPSLSTLTFARRAEYEWFGMFDENFPILDVTGAQQGATGMARTFTQQFACTASADGATLNFAPSSGAWAAYGASAMVQIPTITVGAKFTTLRGGGPSASTVNVGFAKYGTGDYIFAVYDAIGGTVFLQWKNDAGSVQTSSTVSVGIGLSGFTLALGVAGKNAALWWKATDSDPLPKVLATADVSATIDPRAPATLAALRPEVGGTHTGGSGSTSLAWFKLSYAKGTGLGNFSALKDLTNRPVCRDGHLYYLIGSKGFPGYDAGGISATTAMGAAMFEFDTQTLQLKEIAILGFTRSSKIYTENAGAIYFDNATEEFITLIPTWGSAPSTTQIVKYSLKSLPRGVVLLDPGITLTPPDSGAGFGEYDPDLAFIGGKYRLSYSHQVSASGQYWLEVAETSDWSTWTKIGDASGDSGHHIEGSKIINWGGTYYYLATDNDTNTWAIYDSSIARVGSITQPFGTYTHPCLIPFYRPDGRMGMYSLTWNIASYNNIAQYHGGRVEIGEMTNVVIGADAAHTTNFTR